MNLQPKPLWKKIVSILLPVLGIIFVLQSGYSLYVLFRKSDIVGEQQKKLLQLEKEQDELKKQFSDSYKAFFIEKEARNTLGLVKPGETLIYLEKEASGEAKVQQIQDSGRKIQESQQKTIMQQWWDVFF